MSKILRGRLLATYCFALAALLQHDPVFAAKDAHAPSSVSASGSSLSSKKVTLQGGIDRVDFALKSSGVTLDDVKLPALVGNVRLGSPAYYGGLAEGDKVLSAAIIENKLNLLFERKGKRFSLSVHTSPADFGKFVKGVPVKDSVAKNVPAKDLVASDKIADQPLVPGTPLTDEQKLKELAKHDLVILIDTSASMAEPIPSLRQSKWQWCARFLANFAERTKNALAGRGLTIIPFNSSYTIMRSCSTNQVNNLFATTAPNGGTDFASPLQEVLSGYIASGRQRPLMIAVFTDGIPSYGPRVEQVLINATKQLRSAREVKLTFLAIGEDYNGASLLTYLDDFLVHDGAHFDVVQTVAFDQLQKSNLVDALMLVLEHKPEGTGGINSEIAKLREQIENQRLEAEKLEGQGKAERKPAAPRSTRP